MIYQVTESDIIILMLIPMAILAIILILVYKLRMPHSAREIFKAKLFGGSLYQDCTDEGNMSLSRSKGSGYGVVETKNTETKFLPKGNPEPWLTQTFHLDGIPIEMGYSGLTLAVPPRTLAILAINQHLHSENLMEALTKEMEGEGYEGFKLEDLDEDLQMLVKAHMLNVDRDEMPEKLQKLMKEQSGIRRRIAVLLDPRILKHYFKKMWTQAQIEYVKKVAYEKGWKARGTPWERVGLAMMPIVLLVVVVFVFMNFF